MKLGAFDFIEKPVNPTRIAACERPAERVGALGTRGELEANRRKLRDIGMLGSLEWGVEARCRRSSG